MKDKSTWMSCQVVSFGLTAPSFRSQERALLRETFSRFKSGKSSARKHHSEQQVVSNRTTAIKEHLAQSPHIQYVIIFVPSDFREYQINLYDLFSVIYLASKKVCYFSMNLWKFTERPQNLMFSGKWCFFKNLMKIYCFLKYKTVSEYCTFMDIFLGVKMLSVLAVINP